MGNTGEKRKAGECKEPGGPAPRLQLATPCKRRNPEEQITKKKPRKFDQEKIISCPIAQFLSISKVSGL